MRAPFIGSVLSGRPLVGGQDIVGRIDDRSILIRSGAAKRLQRDLGSGQRLELARKPHLQPGTLSVAVSGPDAATVAVRQRASRAQGGSTASLVLIQACFLGPKAWSYSGRLVKEQRACFIARSSVCIPFQCAKLLAGSSGLSDRRCYLLSNGGPCKRAKHGGPLSKGTSHML